MASLGIPAYGYGIRYDHGLFRQVIKDGWQQEYPEDWLSFGNPWEFARPEVIYDIHFGGRVETIAHPNGVARYIWLPDETIEAVAYDTPIVGWRGRHVNPLRLWTARAVDPMRLDVFNRGDHIGALVEQARAEAISKVLYPSDETPAGRELRLRQEYLFVSASLQDLVRAAPAHRRRSAFPAAAGGDPAQRYASEHRDCRADAAARRRARPAVERCLENHRRHVLLHQPHAPARGAGDLAGPPVRARPAAASADHLSDQCRAHRGRETQGSRGLSRPARRHLADRRARRPQAAHGPPRLCRLAPGEWRLRAAHRSDAQDRVSAICTRSIPTASSTRPTGSPSAAGCSRPIRRW